MREVIVSGWKIAVKMEKDSALGLLHVGLDGHISF